MDYRNVISCYLFNDKNKLRDIYFHKLSKTTLVSDLSLLFKDLNLAGTTRQQQIRTTYDKYFINLNTMFDNFKFNYDNDTSKLYSHMVKVYHNDEQYVSYLNSQLKKSIDKSLTSNINFYTNLLKTYLYYEDKFKNQIHKLKNYVLKTQYNLIENVSQIEFKTLTYTDINVLVNADMIQKTVDMTLTNAAILFNIPNVNVFTLPVRYDKKYHGSMNIKYSKSGYKNSQRQYTTTLVFDTVKKQIKIVLTNEAKDTPLLDFKTNKIIGADVNARDNIFALSDGKIIDYNRKLMKKIIDDKNKLEAIIKQRDLLKCNKKSDIKDKEYSKTMLTIQNNINNRVKYLQDYNCHLLLSQYRNFHIILENLERNLRKNPEKMVSKEFSIKCNDLFTLLKMYSVKDTLIRMSVNYNVEISLTNPAYTSQTCNVCHYIHEDNRVVDKFKCLRCGHEDNADHNAAKNIEDRITVNVLRNDLHKHNTNSYYTYKPIYGNKKWERHKFKVELENSFNKLNNYQSLVNILNSIVV